MARDTVDARPVDTIAALAETLAEGCKPESDFRIGTEHEKFGFHTDDLSPISYEGASGVEAVLTGMEQLLKWERIEDAGKIIGLADPTGGGAISIEPGGQFELSGAPLESLHQTCREANSHLAQVRQVAEPLKIGFLGIGMTPDWQRKDIPVMPKSRYEIMTNYMPKVGSLGLDMMYRTSTIQVNLDFSSEADMVKKMRVGLALQPIATAMFANSPFTDGKPNGFKSFRAQIWTDTDRDRTGDIPFVFDEGFGFERYVEWAIDVPMYFVKRGTTYHDVTGTTFREFMNGGLRGRIESPEPTVGDWDNHLSTLFPDVRLKKFIEMRGADGGPWRRICALPALWVGLLYNQDVLDAAWELVKDWTQDERAALRARVPKDALQTPFRSGTVLDIAKEMLKLSQEGLKRRAIMSDGDLDERVHLAPLEESLAAGLSPADVLLKRYEGAWNGDLANLYRDYAY
ncbi:glutamate--cysteine ligase [Roseibium hamelinense]|uniref:Glutamate--cysteine ligase n=1 Tax=Roseibium hamelinense TaxID=150831 RepID=A0A562T2T2_9HYPH|nr:glutamate--cysteine ligase [Roseibium hamelinense]MTI43335.1 glutamate--cysteine ligase [Roseibium hamelinense]TWI87534.1 glutamate--cysteine ligase [Roseibium hamelinense]